MSNDRENPVPHERDEAGSPTSARSDSHEQGAAEDLELGAAVGRALRERSETVWAPPPVSLIEERAAARARARVARRSLASLAASAVLIVGGVVAWNALDGDGAGTVVVSAEAPDAEGRDAEGRDAEGRDAEGLDTAAADGTGATASSAGPSGEAGGPQTDAEPDDTGTVEELSSVEDDQSADPDEPTPEELSTGPVLQWTEIDTGFVDLFRIESVGDGRVLARGWRDIDPTDNVEVAEAIMVTTNGTDWAVVPMPSEIIPDHIDISGDRWVVAGPEAGSDPFDGMLGRAFFSDDEGTTWTELAIGLPPDPAPTSPYVIEHLAVTSAFVSGENIVLVVTTRTNLDLYELLEGRELVPEGKSVVGWNSSRSGSIDFELAGAGSMSGSITLFESGSGSDAVETMSLTYDELGLTDEERATFEGPGFGRVLVYVSDGLTVEMAAEYEGWAWSGVATDEGFALKVTGPRERLITSPDGRVWSEQTSLENGSSAWMAAADGTIWHVGSDVLGTLSMRYGGLGEAPTTTATFEGLQPTGNLAVGPAGLITSAAPVSDAMREMALSIPEGRVAKDGYEVRYNEPEGGVTLWDLDADAAVYVFEAADVMSEQIPEGVREISGGEGFGVVFEDPETGADLVTFTDEDLAPIFMPTIEGSTALLTLEAYEAPEIWAGWSADGTAWGWQLLADAFGIEDGQSWAEFAVGADFVLARVQTIQIPEFLASGQAQAGTSTIEGTDASGSAGGQGGIAWGTAGEPQPPRLFIARIP